MQGTVTDDGGAIVPGAKVTLRNDLTKVEVTSITNDEARYKFDFVEPGNYSLIVEKAGFKIVTQGKHIVMGDGRPILTIPRHNPVNEYTMGGIVRDGGLAVEKFKKLL